MRRVQSLFESRTRFSILFSAILVAGIGWMMLSAAEPASTTSGRIPSPREGFLAPDFTLNTLEGEELTLSDLRGDPVVLNLWATWCPPCRAEMPALQEVYEQNRARGLKVIAVNMTYQDSVSEAEAFVRQYALTFPVPLDTTGVVGNSYQMRALPSTFFIDHEGIIQQVVIGGPMAEATLQAAVEALFEAER